MNAEICDRARAAILERNFTAWRGLPDDCGIAELFDKTQPDSAKMAARSLGDNFVRTAFAVLEVPGYYRPTVSIRDGRLVLFDAMNPELAGGFAPLHATLGEPDARLDWVYGSVPFPKGEWPYPARGITVFVNDTEDRALHVALYRATTLATYRAELRPHLAKQALPRDR